MSLLVTFWITLGCYTAARSFDEVSTCLPRSEALLLTCMAEDDFEDSSAVDAAVLRFDAAIVDYLPCSDDSSRLPGAWAFYWLVDEREAAEFVGLAGFG